MTEEEHSKRAPWVLAAISKVKGQKQQPNEERICNVLTQSYGLDKDAGLFHLKKCVKDGLVICIPAKNGRNCFRVIKGNSGKFFYGLQ